VDEGPLHLDDGSFKRQDAGQAQASGLDGDATSRYLFGAYAQARAKTDAERDAAMALQRIAAEAGEPMAQVAVGAMYERGKTVPRDMAEARRWYGLAAAQGKCMRSITCA
jgi:TPR repeat protein